MTTIQISNNAVSAAAFDDVGLLNTPRALPLTQYQRTAGKMLFYEGVTVFNVMDADVILAENMSAVGLRSHDLIKTTDLYAYKSVIKTTHIAYTGKEFSLTNNCKIFYLLFNSFSHYINNVIGGGAI